MDLSEYVDFITTASFAGRCIVCLRSVCVGDIVADVDGLTFVHVECAPDYVPA